MLACVMTSGFSNRFDVMRCAQYYLIQEGAIESSCLGGIPMSWKKKGKQTKALEVAGYNPVMVAEAPSSALADTVNHAIDRTADVGNHLIDGAVAVTGVIGNTINNLARAHENIAISRINADVRISEIQAQHTLDMAIETDIHQEVMANIDNVSAVASHVVSTPGLNDNPDVVMSLLDAIGTTARQSAISRAQSATTIMLPEKKGKR